MVVEISSKQQKIDKLASSLRTKYKQRSQHYNQIEALSHEIKLLEKKLIKLENSED
jgi:septal ring factor EnvC (AmiA/AmiB activator)